MKGTEIAKQYLKMTEEDMEELIKQGNVLKYAGGFAIEYVQKYFDKREGDMEAIKGMPNTVTKRLLEEVQQ